MFRLPRQDYFDLSQRAGARFLPRKRSGLMLLGCRRSATSCGPVLRACGAARTAAPQTAKPSAMSENRRLCLSPYAPSFECSSEGRRWVFEPAVPQAKSGFVHPHWRKRADAPVRPKNHTTSPTHLGTDTRADSQYLLVKEMDTCGYGPC
jgi:hypothetical protein